MIFSISNTNFIFSQLAAYNKYHKNGRQTRQLVVFADIRIWLVDSYSLCWGLICRAARTSRPGYASVVSSISRPFQCFFHFANVHCSILDTFVRFRTNILYKLIMFLYSILSAFKTTVIERVQIKYVKQERV